MAKHFWKKELSYVGYGGMGKQVRDLIHIKDLFDIIDLQIHEIEKFNGQIFNIGGSRKVSASLMELTALCQNITGNKIPIQSITENRKADIKIYLSDCNKINSITNWEPKISVSQIMEDIYYWITKNETQLKPILS
jgi:CDP-paratose 2-epimerase